MSTKFLGRVVAVFSEYCENYREILTPLQGNIEGGRDPPTRDRTDLLETFERPRRASAPRALNPALAASAQ